MQTWAQRGVRTALVTGGLLMLGTGIANASQHVPATPIDAGGLPGAGSLPAPLGKEETDVLHTTLDTASGNAMTNVDRGTVADDVATPTRLEHVLAAANRLRHSAGFRPANEWGAVTGDLAQLPANHVYRVPGDVVGRAVDSRYAAGPGSDGDTAPRLDLPFGDQAQFGPSDEVDGLLGANQVPRIGDLFRARPRPVADMAHTQVFPVLSDGVPAVSPVAPVSPAELTQRLPVIPATPATPRNLPYLPQPRNTPYDPQPRYEPMSGVLPVTGSLPNTPGMSTPVAAANLPTVNHPPTPNLSTLPDLPPVPTLPAMPPLPGRPRTQAMPAAPVLPQPQVSAPSLPAIPALPRLSGPAAGGFPALGAPAPQDMPAGSAQQLMAQLRGLISDLEQGRQMHPMDGAEQTTLLPRITDDGPVPPVR
ncbi:MAG TPA: hypothetical protein VFW65_06035 [Pseudonocardiaceae bacterium]|nr:hypothetical protein [Pseudonocardiaceae bacterium]